jgi:F0F1-type ATP synthase membrane subunit c/vacuolar-type H+-ATPase subunit K
MQFTYTKNLGGFMELEAAKVIGAGLAVIGVIGSGIGMGMVFSSFITAVGRNPAARSEVFTMTMLGFALVEAVALFALVIALVILFG